ncbi:MAG: RuBisCO large subunit C-terminal-like domain-containing protein [bacterium]
MKKDLIIQYILTCLAEDAGTRAEEIALEQSVELPRSAVKDQKVAGSSIPDILELTPVSKLPDGLTRHRLCLAFSGSLVGRDIPQFFNLLFGNVSLKKGLYIEDMTLPDKVLDLFPGPGYGIKGAREICQRDSGAMLCSVLKPVGSSSHVFADMAEEFAGAGVPFIKDDHGLADQLTSPFKERVKCVQTAIKKSGSSSVYLPNITGPHEDLEEKIAIAFNEGVKGFLVSPFLIGLDTFRYLREKYPVLWMAHPAFSGAFFADRFHGFRPGLLLGTILRLLGADMVIYPDAGGRFSFKPYECRGIADGLREGYEDRFKPAIPVPAGGISASKAIRVRQFYGDDVMLLIGGSIYLHKDGFEKATQDLLNTLSQPLHGEIKRWDISKEGSSHSIDIHTHSPASQPKGVIRQIRPGEWDRTKKLPYKIEGTHFRGITRTELYVPEHGEAGFDIRYFEIEPGGFSSLEKHQHVHFVIGVRGKGEVRIAETCDPISPNDVVFIPRDTPHQLRNHGPEVFGFYCIVDHVRDEPTVITNN